MQPPLTAPGTDAEPSGSVGELASVQAAKQRLRTEAKRRRAAVTRDDRRRRDASRNRALISALDDADCVACYLSTEPEPGTLDLVNQLFAGGTRVLVPVLSGCRTPTWAQFDGPHTLRPGLWGIPEPTNPTLVQLSEASVILCSALLATPSGRRLGVGGGWFDRALTAKQSETPVWALIDDADLVASLPVDTHDHLIDAVATESGLISCEREDFSPAEPAGNNPAI